VPLDPEDRELDADRVAFGRQAARVLGIAGGIVIAAEDIGGAARALRFGAATLVKRTDVAGLDVAGAIVSVAAAADALHALRRAAAPGSFARRRPVDAGDFSRTNGLADAAAARFAGRRIAVRDADVGGGIALLAGAGVALAVGAAAIGGNAAVAAGFCPGRAGADGAAVAGGFAGRTRRAVAVLAADLAGIALDLRRAGALADGECRKQTGERAGEQTPAGGARGQQTGQAVEARSIQCGSLSR
jgi:hypothetical protein